MLAWIFVVITLLVTPTGWDVAGKARVHGPFAREETCEAARDALAARVARLPVAVGFCVPKDAAALAAIREQGLFVAAPMVWAGEAL